MTPSINSGPTVPANAFVSKHFALLHTLAITVLTLLFMLPTGSLSDNEENYFQLAQRTVAPEKFGEYHAVFDASRARIVAEYLLGTLVDHVGYDTAFVIARIGMALLYGLTISLALRGAGLGILNSMLAVVAFRMVGECIFGGEWLFLGVEGKTFAYAFVFLGFYFAQKSRLGLAVLCAAVAGYLHFLVGIFWGGVIILLAGFADRNVKTSIKYGAAFALLMLPLVGIIASEQLGHSGPLVAADGLSVDYIYSALRNAHHTSPFEPSVGGIRWTFGPVLVVALIVFFGVLWLRGRLPLIGIAALTGLCFLIFALGVSYIDRDAHHFGKFYLFRPSSLTLLFTLATLLLVFEPFARGQLKLAWNALAAIAVVGVVLLSAKQQIYSFHNIAGLHANDAMVAAVHKLSGPDDIVLLEPFGEMDDNFNRLPRLIERPTVVSWKFVPTNPQQILRWYSLVKTRETLFKEGCKSALPFTPTLLVSFTETAGAALANCGPVIWQEGATRVVKYQPGAASETGVTPETSTASQTDAGPQS